MMKKKKTQILAQVIHFCSAERRFIKQGTRQKSPKTKINKQTKNPQTEKKNQTQPEFLYYTKS